MAEVQGSTWSRFPAEFVFAGAGAPRLLDSPRRGFVAIVDFHFAVPFDDFGAIPLVPLDPKLLAFACDRIASSRVHLASWCLHRWDLMVFSFFSFSFSGSSRYRQHRLQDFLASA